MNRFAALILRDLSLGWRSGQWWLPVAFFLLVAILVPFAVGPDAALLAVVGSGMLWVAALLAALLPLDRLIAPDLEGGVFDGLSLAGLSDEAVMAARLIAHLILFAIPVALASLPAAALLGLSDAALMRFLTGFAAGAPGLAALGLMIAAITAGQRRSGALGGLLLLPLAIPLLIFGASSGHELARGALLFLAALSLLLVAVAPFIAGAALRAARER